MYQAGTAHLVASMIYASRLCSPGTRSDHTVGNTAIVICGEKTDGSGEPCSRVGGRVIGIWTDMPLTPFFFFLLTFLAYRDPTTTQRTNGPLVMSPRVCVSGEQGEIAERAESEAGRGPAIGVRGRAV